MLSDVATGCWRNVSRQISDNDDDFEVDNEWLHSVITYETEWNWSAIYKHKTNNIYPMNTDADKRVKQFYVGGTFHHSSCIQLIKLKSKTQYTGLSSWVRENKCFSQMQFMWNRVKIHDLNNFNFVPKLTSYTTSTVIKLMSLLLHR